MKGFWILSNAFSSPNEVIILVFLTVIDMVDCIDKFLHVELSLYLWDEANLIMVDDIFDVFLDLVCQNFIEYFCIYVHE